MSDPAEEIARMIGSAENPADRALLLVLSSIANTLGRIDIDLQQHRTQFQAHRTEFTAHVMDEQRLLNRGIGMWMALSAALSLCVGFGGWYVVHHIVDVNESQQHAIDVNSNRLSAIEAELRMMQIQKP